MADTDRKDQCELDQKESNETKNQSAPTDCPMMQNLQIPMALQDVIIQ
jgi:hypothetical protein